jgi:hypothetical protein
VTAVDSRPVALPDFRDAFAEGTALDAFAGLPRAAS